jgi:hypothetical protein
MFEGNFCKVYEIIHSVMNFEFEMQNKQALINSVLIIAR